MPLFSGPKVDTGQPQGLSWERLQQARRVREGLRPPGGPPSAARGFASLGTGLLDGLMGRAISRRQRQFEERDQGWFDEAIGDPTLENLARARGARTLTDGQSDTLERLMEGMIGGGGDSKGYSFHNTPQGVVSGNKDTGEATMGYALEARPGKGTTHETADGRVFMIYRDENGKPVGEQVLGIDPLQREAVEADIAKTQEGTTDMQERRALAMKRFDHDVWVDTNKVWTEQFAARSLAEYRKAGLEQKDEHFRLQTEQARTEFAHKVATDMAAQGLKVDAQRLAESIAKFNQEDATIDNALAEARFQAQLEGRIRSGVTVNTGDRANNRLVAGFMDQEIGISDGIREDGEKGRDLMPSFDLMEQALDDPEFQSGFGQSILDPIRDVATRLGVKDARTMDANAVFKALSNKLLVTDSGGLGRQISDGDRKFYEEIWPNLMKSPEANRALLWALRRIAQRDIEKMEAYDAEVRIPQVRAAMNGQEYSGQTPSEWNNAWYADPNRGGRDVFPEGAWEDYDRVRRINMKHGTDMPVNDAEFDAWAKTKLGKIMGGAQ